MRLRKIITTLTMAAVFFWTPSVIPTKATGIITCGLSGAQLITADTAFAGSSAIPIPCPTPSPGPFPWPVLLFGLGTASVILNGAIVGQTQCRQLTYQEAWTSILFPFIGMWWNQNNNQCHPHHHHHHH